MASHASEIDPAAEPHVVIEEPSSAGGGEGEAPPEATAAEVVVEREAAEGETKAEEEEEGECGFCLYMKAGGCKDAFVAWEQCVQAADNEGTDMVERCSEATTNLKKCMDAHPDHYAIVLQAEQAVSDQAEAAITADVDNYKGEESAPSLVTDETKKDEAVVESAASAADAKEEVVEQAASSMATEEVKKEEAVVQKVESLSLGN